MGIYYKPTVTVAIDPGTDASGVAVYRGTELVELHSLSLPALVEFVADVGDVFVVEDVEANKFMYGRHHQRNGAAQSKVAQNVGMVKATGRQILLFLRHMDKTIVTLPPTGGNWGTLKTELGKQQLATRTGWTEKSNKDTRSAAFFGWLYTQRLKHGQKTRA